MKAAKSQILFLTAAVTFCAAVVRQMWLQNPQAAEQCATSTAMLCDLRDVLLQAMVLQVFGWAGLCFGILAIIRKTLPFAAMALLLGGVALVFHNTALGGGAFAMGIIGLMRSSNGGNGGGASGPGSGTNSALDRKPRFSRGPNGQK